MLRDVETMPCLVQFWPLSVTQRYAHVNVALRDREGPELDYAMPCRLQQRLNISRTKEMLCKCWDKACINYEFKLVSTCHYTSQHYWEGVSNGLNIGSQQLFRECLNKCWDRLIGALESNLLGVMDDYVSCSKFTKPLLHKIQFFSASGTCIPFTRVRGNRIYFLLCRCFGNSFIIKFTSLNFESEDRGWNDLVWHKHA